MAPSPISRQRAEARRRERMADPEFVLAALAERSEVRANGCIEWVGPTSRSGYGSLLGACAHRLAWTHLVGPVADGLHIDHLCRNRLCLNPDHLEPVTARENILRGVGASARNAVKTHCVNGHEFTPENTRRDPDGSRRCVTCKRLRTRDWGRRKRAAARAEREFSPLADALAQLERIQIASGRGGGPTARPEALTKSSGDGLSSLPSAGANTPSPVPAERRL